MILVTYKAIAALLIFLISLVTVLYPLKTRREIAPAERMVLGEALASGIFLGIALFHMLPYSITLFQLHFATLTYPVPEAICAGAFLLLLFLERFYLSRSLLGYASTTLICLMAILIIHSLTEGIALGIGQNFPDTTSIFIAIVANKGSASFALCMTLLHYRLPLKQIVLLIILFSVMTPAGIALGTSVSHFMQSKNGEILLASFNAFAAGAFLYMSTMHHIQFHQRLGEGESRSMPEFSCFALGLIAMAVFALWF